MRKHFLLLFLMAILPLAGWAADLTFYVGTSQITSKKYTGEAIEVTVKKGSDEVTGYTLTYSATDPTVAAGTVVTTIKDAGYYKAAKDEDSGILRIRKVDLSIQPTYIEKTYGATDASLDLTHTYMAMSGFVGDDDRETVAIAGLAISRTNTGENVGDYTYSFTGTPTATNYNILANGTATLRIVPKTIRITPSAVAAKTYGQAVPTVWKFKVNGGATEYSSASQIPANALAWDDVAADLGFTIGTYFGTTKVATPKDAKTYKIKAAITNTNYTIDNDDVDFVINSKTLAAVNFGATQYSKKFGEADPAFTYVLGDGVSLAYDEVPANVFKAVKNDGSALPTTRGAYTIKVAPKNANYTITTAGTAAYTINASGDITFGITVADLTFDGDVLVPVVTVKDGTTTLTAGTHYTLAYYTDEACQNAATIKNAGTYYVKVTGKETTDYEGSSTVKAFTVGKKEVTVSLATAVQNITYEAAPNFTLAYAGFVGGDQAAYTASALTKPTAAIAGWDGTSYLPYKATPYVVTISGGIAPDNYKFKYATTGRINVAKKNIIVNAKAATVTWAGATATATAITTALSGNYEIVPAAASAYLNSVPALTHTAVAGNKYLPADDYVITVDPTSLSLTDQYAANYTISAGANATLKIAKAPLTITAKGQIVNVNATAIDTEIKAATVAVEGFVNGETGLASLVADGTIFTGTLVLAKAAAADLTAAGEYDEGVEISGLASTYYDIDYVNGLLNVVGDGMDLTLTADATLVDKLKAANGKDNVEVSFAGFKLTAGRWNTLVLPFETTVADLSSALGYAVVDMLDTDNTNVNNVSLKLAFGTIPANTPFLVQPMADVDFTDPAVTAAVDYYVTNPVTIDYDYEDEDFEVAAKDKANHSFVGTYADYYVMPAATNEYFYSPSEKKFVNSSRDGGTRVRPMGAYLVDENANARALTISIEEPNGSTTVINTINGEQKTISNDAWYTVNGMKLEGIPTEKGIYIRNGKKVVLK